MITEAGPKHCEWQSATFLGLGWPLGTRATMADGARLFYPGHSRVVKVVSPQGVISSVYQKGWVQHATLPKGAYATGYRFQSIELYLSSFDPDGAYLVAPNGTERWPFASGFKGCA